MKNNIKKMCVCMYTAFLIIVLSGCEIIIEDEIIINDTIINKTTAWSSYKINQTISNINTSGGSNSSSVWEVVGDDIYYNTGSVGVGLEGIKFSDNSTLKTSSDLIRNQNFDTTNFTPSTTQKQCDLILYKDPNLDLVRGKIWVDAPLKFTQQQPGNGIGEYTPPYISLDINTNTLEIDNNGKLIKSPNTYKTQKIASDKIWDIYLNLYKKLNNDKNSKH